MTTAKKSMIFPRAVIKLFENIKQKKRCRSALFSEKRRPAIVKMTERKKYALHFVLTTRCPIFGRYKKNICPLLRRFINAR